MARVVLDTNVLVSAMRSRRGSSFALLRHLVRGDYEVAVSVPLIVEYEDALLRQVGGGPIGEEDVGDLLDAICSLAHRQPIFFLWRPLLPDPKDDMVAELAVAAGCAAVVTHNVRDFIRVVDVFEVDVVRPADFLQQLRGVR